MQAAATIAAHATDTMLAAVARRGGNADDLSAQVGISRSALAVGAEVIPLAKFTCILETAAASRGDELFGLELGRGFDVEGIGPLARLFTTSATVGEALRKYTRYFPTLQSSTRTELIVEDDVARLTYAIQDPTVKFRTQDAYFTIGMEYTLLTRLLGPRLPVVSVDFQHTARRDAHLHQAYFDCPVRFGQKDNAISFSARCLDVPISHADGRERATLERAFEDALSANEKRLDFVASIEAWMAASLCKSISIDINDAARDFGMSLRSFQRKLAALDINYLEIRNRVRIGIARCMLVDTAMPVTAIGLSLGYSEASAFSRSFRKMTGLSPAEFRSIAAAAGI